MSLSVSYLSPTIQKSPMRSRSTVVIQTMMASSELDELASSNYTVIMCQRMLNLISTQINRRNMILGVNDITFLFVFFFCFVLFLFVCLFVFVLFLQLQNAPYNVQERHAQPQVG